MRDAGGDVVAADEERADRTGAKAGLRGAEFARARRRLPRRDVERFGKAERAAIGVPEAVDRVDEEAERRGMDRLGPPRPLLEGEVRWAAERIKRDRSEVLRQPVDDAPAPPVERMLCPVARLFARGESVPARASGHADEHDRADVRERALPLAVGKMERAACGKAGALDGREDGFDRS